jgi:N-acetylneuraminic acid mutarotase
MANGRAWHTATLLPSGRVLVAGGVIDVNATTASASAELYDPSTNTWSSAGNMAHAREFFTATLLPNGKVLVAGGHDPGTGAYKTSSAELYDLSTNTWSYAANMANGRAFHTATLLENGKVLVAGGLDSNDGNLASAELYDPSTNTWSSAGNMIYPRAEHTTTLLTNGTVLVTGGISGRPTICELYW